jgi:hypothetical protein
MAASLVEALPNGTHCSLAGEWYGVPGELLAPALTEFSQATRELDTARSHRRGGAVSLRPTLPIGSGSTTSPMRKSTRAGEALMPDLNPWAVVVAAIASFAAASAYYVVFATQLAEFRGAAGRQPPTWLVPVVEVAEGLVIALVVAWLAAIGERTGWTDGVILGLGLWVAFPVMLLISSVVHENVAWRLAALHAGDWLVKLLLIAVIVTVWH